MPDQNTIVTLTSVGMAIGTIIVATANFIVNHRSKVPATLAIKSEVSEPKVIIYVDDNPDDTDLLVRQLRNIGLRNPVVSFHSSEQAYLYMHEHDNVLLLVTDAHMVSNGYKLLDLVKQDPDIQDMPVVILSGSTPESVEMYRRGATCYAEKPLDVAELLHCLYMHGFSWEMYP